LIGCYLPALCFLWAGLRTEVGQLFSAKAAANLIDSLSELDVGQLRLQGLELLADSYLDVLLRGVQI
jgi:hypothetical protein